MASFFSRLDPLGGHTVGSALIAYSLIFALPIPLLVLHFRQLTGGSYVGSMSTFNLAAVTMVLTVAFLNQGAVLEELGWRGFAVPELHRTIESRLSGAFRTIDKVAAFARDRCLCRGDAAFDDDALVYLPQSWSAFLAPESRVASSIALRSSLSE